MDFTHALSTMQGVTNGGSSVNATRKGDGAAHAPLSYTEHDGTLIVQVSGTLASSMCIDILRAAFDEAGTRRRQNVLFDVRETTLESALPDWFAFGESLRELGLSAGMRAAVLYSRSRDEREFIEMVAANRGFAFRYFTRREDALAWLGERT